MGISKSIWPTRVRPITSDFDIDVGFEFADCNDIKVWRGTCSTGMMVKPIDAPASVTFHMPISGHMILADGAKKFSADSTSGGINIAEAVNRFEYSQGFDHLAVTLSTAAIEHRVAHLLDSPLRKPVEFNANFAMNSVSAEMLKSLVLTLVFGTRPELRASNPLTEKSLSETIVTLLVEGFSHTYSESMADAATRSGNDVAPRYVKRAISYMKAEAHRPLSMMEIARDGNISVRALQYGFKRFTGVSPLIYLQRIRLTRAIEDLAAAPDHVTISEIARRWGFSNASRFAAMCLARFGERPSQLRRRRILPSTLHGD